MPQYIEPIALCSVSKSVPGSTGLAFMRTLANMPRALQHAPGARARSTPLPSISFSATRAQPTSQQLPNALVREATARFGFDFSRITVLADDVADSKAARVRAAAYTVGDQIVFGCGRYQPASPAGQRLIAHELAHVVQQTRPGNGPLADGASAEREADMAATAYASAAPTIVLRMRAPVAIACKDAHDADDEVRPDAHEDTATTAKRWARDEKAARYRGRIAAKRVLNHGKISDANRATMNRELAYFEGSAREAYIHEIAPALKAVTEIEMPAINASKPLPKLSNDQWEILHNNGLCPGGCFDDAKIYADQKKKDADELNQRKEAQLLELWKLIEDWRPEDQLFARELLRAILDRNVAPDPRGVSDAIRQSILDRYNAWLHAVDEMRLKSCDPDRGAMETAKATLRNDDPCKSWFKESTHGPESLASLERSLKLHRDAGPLTPAQKVYWDVFEYRKRTDPKMLQMEADASEMVGSLAALGRFPEPVIAPAQEVLIQPPPPTRIPVAEPTPSAGPVARMPIGFRPSNTSAPTPERIDAPPPLSPHVAGFGRDIEPAPPRGPVSDEPPLITQMPPARVMPPSSSEQQVVGTVPHVGTGIKQSQPAMAMGGKRPPDSEPKAGHFLRDFPSSNTNNWSAYYASEGDARQMARRKVGNDPVEVEPNKWRSRDGKWQYRAKPDDVADGHIHLEELDPATGEVKQNVHLRWPVATGR